MVLMSQLLLYFFIVRDQNIGSISILGVSILSTFFMYVLDRLLDRVENKKRKI